VKYGTKEFYEQAKEKVNANEVLLRKTRGLSFKFQNLMTDCPGGVDRLIDWELDKGRIASVKVEEKPAPSEWRKIPLGAGYLMRTIGAYDTYVKLNKKEITAVQGQMSGAFKLDGDLTKVMAKLAEFTYLTDFMATIPCEY